MVLCKFVSFPRNRQINSTNPRDVIAVAFTECNSHRARGAHAHKNTNIEQNRKLCNTNTRIFFLLRYSRHILHTVISYVHIAIFTIWIRTCVRVCGTKFNSIKIFIHTLYAWWRCSGYIIPSPTGLKFDPLCVHSSISTSDNIFRFPFPRRINSIRARTRTVQHIMYHSRKYAVSQITHGFFFFLPLIECIAC